MIEVEPGRFAHYIVFSVSSPEGFRFWADSHNLPYKRLQGRYKGQDETSFIVNANTFQAIHVAHWVEDQESVLVLGPQDATLDGSRKAYLYWLADKRVEPIGHLRHVEQAVAEASDAFTYDPSSGQYWVAQAA